MSQTISSSGDLSERILDAFPSGSYALSGLLRLLDIVETDRVHTAAVECKVQPRMLINPAFVDRHAATPEKLLMLVMHELHHVLLGHTTLFPRLTPAQNFVFDAVINGLLCRMFPSVEYTSFLTDFYRDDRFPECLLRPPTNWCGGSVVTVPGIDRLDEPLRSRALEVHAALYSDGGASYHEVYELLPRLLLGGEAGSLQVPLLGGHEESGEAHSDLERVSPVLFDMVRELVEQWPQPPDPIRGRSLADVLRTNSIFPKKLVTHRSTLRMLIRKVAGHRDRGRVRRSGLERTATQSPVPSLSRRSLILHALGTPTLLHDGEVARRRTRFEGERVHVYLDVSGSMDSILRDLYGAVLDCEKWVHPDIHLFSTKVVDISLSDLRGGKCVSTGGTSIDCVAEHMSLHGVRRALLLTDGWVGRPAGQHLQTLSKARLAVAFLGSQINQNDLAAVADHTAVLNTGEGA